MTQTQGASQYIMRIQTNIFVYKFIAKILLTVQFLLIGGLNGMLLKSAWAAVHVDFLRGTVSGYNYVLHGNIWIVAATSFVWFSFPFIYRFLEQKGREEAENRCYQPIESHTKAL